MTISINTPHSIYKTIGHTEDFKPVLYFKIGQRKQAIEDLTNYFNTFGEVLATGIQFTEEDYIKYNNQFEFKARQKAIETIARMDETPHFVNDRFFTFLGTWNKAKNKFAYVK